MLFLLVIIGLGILLYFLFQIINPSKKTWKEPTTVFPDMWRNILLEEVSFYYALSPIKKGLFERKVQEFLLNHKISGVSIQIDVTDKLLVAASAVIPIFAFPNWRYDNLKEVLLYPSVFNIKFDTESKDGTILGMVGKGTMEGKMILSQPALRNGFSNRTDKKNTAIHEFVHLIDKADEEIDGIPKILLDQPHVLPWLTMIQNAIQDIYEEQSDINPYATTNPSEFFAVVSEYFFEQPKLLEQKHPQLYLALEKIFKQDVAELNYDATNETNYVQNPCPCDSGLPFSTCCGKKKSFV